MRQIIVIALLMLYARYAYATSQEPEKLIFNGATNQMFSTPLEAYFTSNNPRPKVWKQVQNDIVSSRCWRCYIGTWAIRDGYMFLDDLQFCEGNISVPSGAQVVQDGATNRYTSPAPLLLPDKILPLKADWFSGVIRLPQGEELTYVHMGFGSIYERDHFIKIEQGKIVAEKTVENLNNPKLYTSDADLQWRELDMMSEGAGITTDDPFHPVTGQKDEENWYDARLIRTTNFLHIVESGKPFTTRGILVCRADDLFGDEFSLFIPPTALTQPIQLPLAGIPAVPKLANGSHVEIVAQFKKTEHAHAIYVISIRDLRKDESIHRQDYRLPDQAPEGSATKLAEPQR